MTMPRWIFPMAVALLCSVSAQAETVQVTIDKLVFSPADVTVKVGDTIEWVNKDMLAHTATATNRAFNVVIAPKKNASAVMSKAGTFDYYCIYHPNMKGRITVAP